MSAANNSTPRGATALVVAALGVVYGDIGTSPLYAFRESLGGTHGIGTSPEVVLGVLSMIFWAVTVVISLKYVLLVLIADNDGEGGDLALLALVLRQLPSRGRLRRIAIIGGLVSASMFYGDSVITPAISVLSAVEGLHVVSAAFEHAVLPLTLLILLVLFISATVRHRAGRQRVRTRNAALVPRACGARRRRHRAQSGRAGSARSAGRAALRVRASGAPPLP